MRLRELFEAMQPGAAVRAQPHLDALDLAVRVEVPSKVARCRICLYRRSSAAVLRSAGAARPGLHLRGVLV